MKSQGLKIKSICLAIILLLVSGMEVRGDEDMGMFDQLFGKDKNSQNSQKVSFDASKLVKSGTMIDEDQYWGLVEQSLKMTKNMDQQEAYLIKELEKLSPEEMIGFRLRTDKLLYDTYNSAMWCAAYIMNDGCSDDCFEYFRL